jgi:hypothetical protein
MSARRVRREPSPPRFIWRQRLGRPCIVFWARLVDLLVSAWGPLVDSNWPVDVIVDDIYLY